MSLFNSLTNYTAKLALWALFSWMICYQLAGQSSTDQDSCTIKLFEAVRLNDLDEIRDLVARGCDLNSTNKTGVPPLRLAVFYCDTTTLKYMLDSGADPNFAPSDFTSGTHYAAGSETDKFRFMLNNGGEINTFNHGNFPTPLIWAIEQKRTENVVLMLDRGVIIDPDPSNNFNSALGFAISKSRFEIIDLLIDGGADLNAKFTEDHSGDCFCCPFEIAPLHKIVSTYSYSENKDSLSLLMAQFIDKGADVNITNEQGLTPLNFAAFINAPSLAKLLIESGARLNNSIHSASMVSNFEMIEVLLEYGSDPNQLNQGGNTPLLSCITCCGDGAGAGIKTENRVKTIELLIDAGADPYIKDKQGKSFWDYCDLESRAELKEILISHDYLTK